MKGCWIRATRLVTCISIGCDRGLVRDEAVYLVSGIANLPVCSACAFRRFQYVPPADLPHLPLIVDQPAPVRGPLVSDAAEPVARRVPDNWGSVATKSKGELARIRREL